MRCDRGLRAVTVALLTTTLAGQATAEGLDAKSAYPWNWSGLYIGGHIGGGSVPTDWVSAQGSLATLTPFEGKGISDGIVGGGQIGVNFQSGAVVWGLEAEAAWADLHGHAKCVKATYVCDTTLGLLGTVSGRLGYAFDHTLLYVKAGGAWARETYDMQSYFFSNRLHGTESRWGWTAGAGLEYAFAGPWSAKLEYTYIDLGKDSVSLADQFGNASTIQVEQASHIVKLGLNYRLTGERSSAAQQLSSIPTADWTGFYLGLHTGAGWGRSDWSDPAGSVSVAAFPFSFGNREIDGTVAGGQVGANYQSGSWVLGVEADASWSDIDGNAKCDNAAGQALTCHSHISSLGTLTGRLGIAAGNNLFYAKLGGAWAHGEYDIKSFFVPEKYNASHTRWGWTAGAGVEYALLPRWSIKAEYNYLGFRDEQIGFAKSSGGVAPFNIEQHIHLIKSGINYRFGAPGSGAAFASSGIASKTSYVPGGWRGEIGSRYWYSSGRIQKDLFDPFLAGRLNSRLSHDDLTGHAGEFFARFDHDNGLFVKGIFGAGNLVSGTLVDEDFPGATGYSNTASNIDNGRMRYASLDVGYNFLNTPQGQLGAFLGYRHFHQRSNGYGCRQLGPDVICAPPISDNVLVLSETTTWRGAAVGLNARMPVSDRLSLDVDAAYLPYLTMAAIDNHWLRPDINPQMQTGHGSGAQVEAALSYALTGRWSVGAGGRYWFMTADANTQFPGVATLSPMKFYTERYGAFVQSSYKFGADPALSARAAALPVQPAERAHNWTGVYAGVHLGAGRDNTDWSNPFGPQVFGDDIRAGGAIAGGQIGFNYQFGTLVAGLEAEASWSGIEGSNTCFVGLTTIGGIDCRAEVSGLATVAGRLGYARDRNLFFVKGGVAWARGDYEINLVGSGTGGLVSASADRSGWLLGAGIERAVTPSWSLKLEYGYADFGSQTVAFNVAPPIDRVPIEQRLHLFKLGANYKLN